MEGEQKNGPGRFLRASAHCRPSKVGQSRRLGLDLRAGTSLHSFRRKFGRCDSAALPGAERGCARRFWRRRVVLESHLPSREARLTICGMAMPTGPVTLTVQQVEELTRKLATLRHDINNNLSLITAAVELLKLSPEMIGRLSASLAEQPPKISDQLTKFALELEKAVGVTRG